MLVAGVEGLIAALRDAEAEADRLRAENAEMRRWVRRIAEDAYGAIKDMSRVEWRVGL